MADCIQISWNLPSGLCVAWDLMGRTVRDSWDFPLLSHLPHSCWERRSQNHWIDINQLTVALTLLIARVGCSCRIQRGKSKYLSVCYSLHCSVVQESVLFFSWFDFIFPTYVFKNIFCAIFNTNTNFLSVWRDVPGSGIFGVISIIAKKIGRRHCWVVCPSYPF